MATSSNNRSKAQDLLKTAGINKPPVDVKTIAGMLGFSIIATPFSEKRRGSAIVEGVVRVIGVNSDDPVYLQRYTACHELGHFVNGHSHIPNDFIDDDTKYYSSHFQQEREADAFAAEILMPKDFLIKDLIEIKLDVPKLAALYQVSEKAMQLRLNILRLSERFQAK